VSEDKLQLNIQNALFEDIQYLGAKEKTWRIHTEWAMLK
jgi:hypothetical protein